MRRHSRGFTLVEILIVVIILGILAAIVIPQFTQASSAAREVNLKTNLKTMRNQLLLYKVQHLDVLPTSSLVTQLTQYTDLSGGTATARDATHTFGPYLQAFPVNSVSNSAAVRVVTTAFAAPTTDGGWWYNSTTGEVRVDLKDSYVSTDGTKYNAF